MPKNRDLYCLMLVLTEMFLHAVAALIQAKEAKLAELLGAKANRQSS